jgi:hypothetical protein
MPYILSPVVHVRAIFRYPVLVNGAVIPLIVSIYKACVPLIPASISYVARRSIINPLTSLIVTHVFHHITTGAVLSTLNVVPVNVVLVLSSIALMTS